MTSCEYPKFQNIEFFHLWYEIKVLKGALKETHHRANSPTARYCTMSTKQHNMAVSNQIYTNK